MTVDSKYTYADKICQVAVVYNKKLDLLVVGVYRPPVAEEESFTACLKKIQETITKHDHADIQIHGDFNMPYINWDTKDIERAGRLTSEQNSAKKLIAFMEKNFLTQVVKCTTRLNNTLDLILTNNDQAIHSVYTEKTEISDHEFVHCDLLYKFNNTKTSQCNATSKSPLDLLYFLKADWNSIRSDMEKVKWNEVLTENDSVDNMVTKFEETITNICYDHTPKRKITTNKKQRIPNARLRLLRKRRRLNSKINICTYFKPINYKDKLINLNKRKEDVEIEIRDSIRKERDDKEKEVIAKIKTNPRAFFSYAKRNCKTYSSIGPLLDLNNKLQSDPQAMTEILQEQYKKAFSDPDTGAQKTDDENINTPILNDVIFNEEDIIRAIGEIPTSSAPGPDKIPSILLKECKKELAPALFIIWRKSLDTGQIPNILKKQSIVPIHKKDSKALPANYRPVSLTSHLIKVFE